MKTIKVYLGLVFLLMIQFGCNKDEVISEDISVGLNKDDSQQEEAFELQLHIVAIEGRIANLNLQEQEVILQLEEDPKNEKLIYSLEYVQEEIILENELLNTLGEKFEKLMKRCPRPPLPPCFDGGPIMNCLSIEGINEFIVGEDVNKIILSLIDVNEGEIIYETQELISGKGCPKPKLSSVLLETDLPNDIIIKVNKIMDGIEYEYSLQAVTN